MNYKSSTTILLMHIIEREIISAHFDISSVFGRPSELSSHCAEMTQAGPRSIHAPTSAKHFKNDDDAERRQARGLLSPRAQVHGHAQAAETKTRAQRAAYSAEASRAAGAIGLR